jgi:hypothetical protein
MIEIEDLTSGVRRQIAAAYPDLEAELDGLCMRRGEYLGLQHVYWICELVGVDPEPEIFQALATAHVSLNAFYFLLDAVVDRQLSDPIEAIYLPPLFELSVALYSVALKRANTAWGQTMMLPRQRLVQNLMGIRIEKDRYGASDNGNGSLDRRSAIGRSNTVLVLYEAVRLVSNAEASLHATKLIEDLIANLQAADDIADWREDEANGRRTPFLRGAYKLASARTDLTLEEVILLSGYWEAMVAEVITALEDIAHQLRNSASPLSAPAFGAATFRQAESMRVFCRTRGWSDEFPACLLPDRREHSPERFDGKRWLGIACLTAHRRARREGSSP